MQFIKKNWFLVSIILILLFSVFLRFFNYQNRVGLAYDQAYGAIVARYALETGKIPLVGPFSSAGPFQTGGEWYWFIMLGWLLNPGYVYSPWIFLSLNSIFFVFLIIILSRELVDRKFSLIVGILAAVSTSQIAQSFSLTNQSVISLFSSLSILFLILYIKRKNPKYLFFLGLSISFAATIHLQGVALITLVIALFIFYGVPGLFGLSFLFLGLFLPVTPLLLFDVNNHFINLHNMYQYYLYDQYKISLNVLGRNWVTYLGNFWPSSLPNIVGGNRFLSIFIAGSSIFLFVYLFLKRKLQKEWLVILGSFVLDIIFLRYLRTPLFDSYLMFVHPFIFLIIGFAIYFLYKKNYLLGSILLIIIVIGSIRNDLPGILFNGNYSGEEANRRVYLLQRKFPKEKFSIYTYKYEGAGNNLILELFLYSKDLISENGRKISLVVATRDAEFNLPTVTGVESGYRMVNLSGLSSAQLITGGWGRVDPVDIYKATEDWYKK